PMEISQKLSQDEGIAQVEGKKTGACETVRQEHDITINKGVISPAYIKAGYCDALVFTTADAIRHDIVFGTAVSNESYAGQNELFVSNVHGQMLILSETGSYSFYDRVAPQIKGSFTVTK